MKGGFFEEFDGEYVIVDINVYGVPTMIYNPIGQYCFQFIYCYVGTLGQIERERERERERETTENFNFKNKLLSHRMCIEILIVKEIYKKFHHKYKSQIVA